MQNSTQENLTKAPEATTLPKGQDITTSDLDSTKLENNDAQPVQQQEIDADNVQDDSAQAQQKEDPRSDADVAIGIPKEDYISEKYADLVGTAKDSYDSLKDSIGSNLTSDDSIDSQGETPNTDNGLQLNSVSSVLQYEAITATPAKSIWNSNKKVKDAFIKEYDGDEAKAEEAFISDYTERVDKELHNQKIKRFQIQAQQSYAVIFGIDKIDDVSTFKPTLPGNTVSQSIDGSMELGGGLRTAPTRSVREAEVFSGTDYIDANGKIEKLHTGDTYRDMIENPAYASKDGRLIIAHTYVPIVPGSRAVPMLKAVYEGDKLQGEIVKVWDYSRGMMRSNTLDRTGIERIWAPFARTAVNITADLVSGFTNAGIIIADAVSGEDVGSDLAHKLERWHTSSTDADTGHPMTFNNIADFTVNMAAQMLLAWATGGLAEGAVGAMKGVSTAAEIEAAQTAGVGSVLKEGLELAGKPLKTLTTGEKALARAFGTGFVYGPMMGYQVREVALQKGFSTESADMLSLATTVLAGAIFAASDIIPGSSQGSYLFRAFTKNGEKRLEGAGIRMGEDGLEFINNETAIKAAADAVAETEKDAVKISKIKALGTKFHDTFPKLAKKISDINFARTEALNVPDGIRSMWWSSISGAQTMGTVSVMNAALESLWSIPAINNKYDRYGELKPYFWTFEDTEFWKQWKGEFASSIIAGAAGGVIGTTISRGWNTVMHPLEFNMEAIYETAMKAGQGDQKALGEISAMYEAIDKNTKKGAWGSKILSTEIEKDGKFLSVDESVSKISQAEAIGNLFKREIGAAMAITSGHKGSFSDFLANNPAIRERINTENGMIGKFTTHLKNMHDAIRDVPDELVHKMEVDNIEDINKVIDSTEDEPTIDKTDLSKETPPKEKESTEVPKKEQTKEDTEAEKALKEEEDKKAKDEADRIITETYTVLSDETMIDYNKKLSKQKEITVSNLSESAGISKYNARKYLDAKEKMADILSGKEAENMLMENRLSISNAVITLAKLDPALAAGLPRLLDKLLAADEKALREGAEKYKSIKLIMSKVEQRIKSANSIEDLINMASDKDLLVDGKIPLDPKTKSFDKKLRSLLREKYKDTTELVKKNLIISYVLPVLRNSGDLKDLELYHAALIDLAESGNESAKKLAKELKERETANSVKVTEEDYKKIKAGESVIPTKIPEDYTGKIYEIKLKSENLFKGTGGVKTTKEATSITENNILETLLYGENGQVTVVDKRASILENLLVLLNERLSEFGPLDEGTKKLFGIADSEIPNKNNSLTIKDLFNAIADGTRKTEVIDADGKPIKETDTRYLYELLTAITNLNEINDINSIEGLINIRLVSPKMTKIPDKGLNSNEIAQIEYFRMLLTHTFTADFGTIDDPTRNVLDLKSSTTPMMDLHNYIYANFYPENEVKNIVDDFKKIDKVRKQTQLKSNVDPFTDVIGMFLRNYEVIDGEVITTTDPLINSGDLGTTLAWQLSKFGGRVGEEFSAKIKKFMFMLDGALKPQEEGYEGSYKDILMYAKENFSDSVLYKLISSIKTSEGVSIFDKISEAKDLAGKILTRMAMIDLFTDMDTINTLASLRELNAKIFNKVEFFSPISSDDRLKYSKTVSRYIYDPVRMVEYLRREFAGTLSESQARDLNAMKARQDVLVNVGRELLDTGHTLSRLLMTIGEESKNPEKRIVAFKSDFYKSLADIGVQFELISDYFTKGIKNTLGLNDKEYDIIPQELKDNIEEYNKLFSDSIKTYKDVSNTEAINKLSVLYEEIANRLYELPSDIKKKLYEHVTDVETLAMLSVPMSEYRKDMNVAMEEAGISPTFKQSRAQFAAYAAGVQKEKADSDVSMFSNTFYKNVIFVEGMQGSGKSTVVATVSRAIQTRLEARGVDGTKILAVGFAPNQTMIVRRSIKNAGGNLYEGDIDTAADLFSALTGYTKSGETEVQKSAEQLANEFKSVGVLVIDEATFISAKTTKENNENTPSGSTDLELILNAVNKINSVRDNAEGDQLRVILLGSKTQGGYETGMPTLSEAKMKTDYKKLNGSISLNIGVAELGMILHTIPLETPFRFAVDEIADAANQIIAIRNMGDLATKSFSSDESTDVVSHWGIQEGEIAPSVRLFGGVRFRTTSDKNIDIWNDAELVNNMKAAIEARKDSDDKFTIAIVYDGSAASADNLPKGVLRDFALENEGNVTILDSNKLMDPEGVYANTVSTVQGGEFNYIVGEVPKGLLVPPRSTLTVDLKRWGLLSMLVGRAKDYADFVIKDKVPIRSEKVEVIHRFGAFVNNKIFELWGPIYEAWSRAVPVVEDGLSDQTPEPTKNPKHTQSPQLNAWEDIIGDDAHLLDDINIPEKITMSKLFSDGAKNTATVKEHVAELQAKAKKIITKDAQNKSNISEFNNIINEIKMILKALDSSSTFIDGTQKVDGVSYEDLKTQADVVENFRKAEDTGANRKLAEDGIVKAYMQTTTERYGMETPEASIMRLTNYSYQLYGKDINIPTEDFKINLKTVLDDFSSNKNLNDYRVHIVLHSEPVDTNVVPHLSIVAETKDGGKYVIAVLPVKSIEDANIDTLKNFNTIILGFKDIISKYTAELAKHDTVISKLQAAKDFIEIWKGTRGDKSYELELTSHGGKTTKNNNPLYFEEKRLPGIKIDIPLLTNEEAQTEGGVNTTLEAILAGRTPGYIHTYDGYKYIRTELTGLYKVEERKVNIDTNSDREVAYIGRVSIYPTQHKSAVDFIAVAYDKGGNAIGPAYVYTENGETRVRVAEDVNKTGKKYLNAFSTSTTHPKTNLENLINTELNNVISVFNKSTIDPFLIFYANRLGTTGGKTVSLETLLNKMKDTNSNIEFSPIVGITTGAMAGRVAVLYRYGKGDTDNSINLSNIREVRKVLENITDAASETLEDSPKEFYSKRDGVGILFLDSPRITLQSLVDIVLGSEDPNLVTLSQDITRRIASANGDTIKDIMGTIVGMVKANTKEIIGTGQTKSGLTDNIISRFITKLTTGFGTNAEKNIKSVEDISPETIEFLRKIIIGTNKSAIVATSKEGVPIFNSVIDGAIKIATLNDTQYAKFDLADFVSTIFSAETPEAIKQIAKDIDDNLNKNSMVLSPVFGSKYSTVGDWVFLPIGEAEAFMPHLLTTVDFIARPSLLINIEDALSIFPTEYKEKSETRASKPTQLGKDIKQPEYLYTDDLTNAAKEKIILHPTINEKEKQAIVHDIKDTLPKDKAEALLKMLFRLDKNETVFKEETAFGNKNIKDLNKQTKDIIKRTIISNEQEYKLVSNNKKDIVEQNDIDLYNIQNRNNNGITVSDLPTEIIETAKEDAAGNIELSVGSQKVIIPSAEDSNLSEGLKLRFSADKNKLNLSNIIINNKLTEDVAKEFTPEAVNAIDKVIESVSSDATVADIKTKIAMEYINQKSELKNTLSAEDYKKLIDKINNCK